MTIASTNSANTYTYYSLIAAQNSGVFAGSCAIVTNSSENPSFFDYAAGKQTLYNLTTTPTVINTSGLPNTLNTAYRADVVSDLMVSMAVMYLESMHELPFARTAAIPSTYLPSTYTTATTLVNPAYPNVPITLNMLLMHTSSISEVNFDLGAAVGPTGTVPTLSSFVSSLFSATTSIFSSTMQPGLGTSYYYSRTNTAIVSYVLEQVLAASASYSSLSGLADFVFRIVLPPLGLTNTFLLDRNGQYIQTSYPFSSTSTFDMRPYKSVQDLTTDGTAILTSYPIHASYFSDYMLYTTTADLAKLAREVFVRDGMYYKGIGALMLDTTVSVTTSNVQVATGRTPGLFIFGPNLLCAMFYAAVGSTGTLPYCYFNGTSLATDISPFGLVATGGNNQVAIVCIPLKSYKTYCSVAEVSFNTSATWPAANAATGGNLALGFAMVNLARFASDKQPTTPSTSNKLNGWYIFVGVVASLAVVVGAAFAADYFIQPPPPAKIIAPIMTGDGMGMRAGTALTEGAQANNNAAGVNAGGAAGGNTNLNGDSIEEPVDGLSPKNFRDTATTTESTVTTTTSSGSPPQRGDGRHRHHTHRNNNNHGVGGGGGGARRGYHGTAHRRGSCGLYSDSDRDDGEYNDGDDGGANDETPYILRSINRHGESSLRRRRHRPVSVQDRHQRRRDGTRHDNGEVSSDDGSYVTPDDGWGDNAVDVAERSSTGSQRPNPNGMLRFDAYI